MLTSVQRITPRQAFKPPLPASLFRLPSPEQFREGPATLPPRPSALGHGHAKPSTIAVVGPTV